MAESLIGFLWPDDLDCLARTFLSSNRFRSLTPATITLRTDGNLGVEYRETLFLRYGVFALCFTAAELCSHAITPEP